MKCPWTNYTQTRTYNKLLDNYSGDIETTEVTTAQFGECVKGECPFFDELTGICKRAKM